ncbi:MAG: MFS transporter [Acidobacteria bacterium]|nr:MAG: MFS transporter [Acidobacteriota bacterium]PYV75902.1 MAG: MFS transporter [Acidobacteriota bacterium]
MRNFQHSRGSVISMTTAEPQGAKTEASPSRVSIRWIRIIPVALIMYTIAFIDRTNISLALPHISRDLHLDPQQAGTVAGIFFWGYLALQIPGGHLAKHWSAKKFIGVLLVVWAIFAVGCGFARTYRELLLLRLLLGVAESGVYPATLILLSHWFSRAERARANAFWLLCLPGAVILASPFSGWILDHWNWRVMLIAEGSLPFVWLAIWLLFIQDHPAQASWLPEDERTRLVETLHRESAELEGSQKVPYLRALLRPEVFLLAAIYFCFVSGQMGLLFWLPSAMDKFRKLSSLSTGMLYTLPFIVGAISVLAVSRHSDKMRERRFHAAGAMLFGGTCILLAVATIPYSLLIAFGFIALSGVGAYGPMGAFWAIPTETLSPQIVGSVMGFVNAIGNLGAYFAPLIVGYLNKRTGSFLAGFTYLGVITLVAGGLTMLIKTAPVHAKAGT